MTQHPFISNHTDIEPNIENDIAIIGWSGKFPNASNIDQFWHNILAVQDCTQALSTLPEKPDPDFVARVSKLEDIDLFDANFFGYSPKEAASTDPQQRLFLEQAWLAMENAGYAPLDAKNCNIGVFGGCSISTYLMTHLMRNPQFHHMDPIDVLMSNDKDFLATRVSHKLGFTGPALTVQTACSTSLVAVHVACQNLLNGECDMALAGGSTILLPEDTGYLYTEGGIRSPDGFCRPFDHQSDGTIFGSGCAIIVLKRLEDALEENCHIHAVIKGSAINNDGNRKIGFTAPSVTGQRDVIIEALEIAGLDSQDIGAIECHGTATRLGDPIEISALQQAFAQMHNPDRPDRQQDCVISSVKGNVGHLDTAAGITGLIKAALMIRDAKLPGTAHFEAANPALNLDQAPFSVHAMTQDWPETLPRHMGVSAFGVGGTNAHIILGAAPKIASHTIPVADDILLLSARTSQSLEKFQATLAQDLSTKSDYHIADIAYSLRVGRHFFDQRCCLIADNAMTACHKLQNQMVFMPEMFLATGTAKTAFAFPGQGMQRAGMAAEFYQADSDFAGWIDQCLSHLDREDATICRQCLLDESDDSQKLITQTRYAQPCLFIFGYALFEKISSMGVQADYAIGHSIGEYLAAIWAGVFSLSDALKLVIARGRVMQAAPSGAMLSVNLSPADISPLISEFDLEIAVQNTQNSCVVAGEKPQIDSFSQYLETQHLKYRHLVTSHAFHSKMMAPVLSEFRQIVQTVTFKHPQKPILSNVTGQWMTADDATDPDYWVNHLRAAVQFHDNLLCLAADTAIHLLELGPGQSISFFAKNLQGQHPIHALSVMEDRFTSQKNASLLAFLGSYWTAGGEIDWDFGKQPARRVPLAGYQFDRQRHWVGYTEQNMAVEVSDHAEAQPLTPENIRQIVQNSWQTVLGITETKTEDNFFTLGGSSIQVLELTRYLKRHQISLTPQDVFQHPTCETLCAFIAENQNLSQDNKADRSHTPPTTETKGKPAPDLSQSILSVLESKRQ